MLRACVVKGRKEFLQQFPNLADPATQDSIPDPADPVTFERSKLDLAEREHHREAYALHHDLLRLRRDDPVFRAQQVNGEDGAVLGAETFVLRFFGDAGDDRLLLVNLGMDYILEPAPEPLLAPPEGQCWALLWSSEAPSCGGGGLPALVPDEAWTIPAQAAMVLHPVTTSST